MTTDTNILISGLLDRRGKPFQILRMGLDREINLAVSQPIIDEVVEVMTRRFGTKPDEVSENIALIREAARIVQPSVFLNVVRDDRDDNRILECAVSAGSDVVVTGDNHLLKLRSYDSIKILTVSTFLELMQFG